MKKRRKEGAAGANRPHALLIGKYYHPFKGGIEDNVKSVAHALVHDHEVTVLAFQHNRGGTSFEEIRGIKVIRARTLKVIKSQPISIAYAWHIITSKADIIHFHAPNVWASLFINIRLMTSMRKPKVVVTHHMDIFGRPLLRRLALRLYRFLLKRSSVLIVTSAKNAIVSKDIDVPVRLATIPLGLDLTEYVLSDDIRSKADEIRAQYPNHSIITFVGRHARYKGLDVLLDAVSGLDNAVLLLGGQGPYTAKLKSKVQRDHLCERVVFLGSLSHEAKLAVLHAADVFVFPSTEITEAFGISQLEAMAVGTPVVASDLPTGVTDVSVDKVSALLAPPANATILRQKITQMIQDKPLASRLSDEAKRRVFTLFNNDVVIADTVGIIRSLSVD